jgi:hypothetical protein
MKRISLAMTAAAVGGAVAISLAGAGVASATGTVSIGPVHPQIDTLVGGIVTNVRTANQLVGNGNGSNLVGPAPVHPNGGN